MLFISLCRFLKTDGSLCAERKCLLTGLARAGGCRPTTTTGIGESVSNSAVCLFFFSLSRSLPPSEESANRRTVTTAAALFKGQPTTVVVSDTKHPITHYVLSCLDHMTVVPHYTLPPSKDFVCVESCLLLKIINYSDLPHVWQASEIMWSQRVELSTMRVW